MRRLLKYFVLAAVTVAAVLTVYALDRPRERPPLQYSDIYIDYPPPDRSEPVNAEIDVHRNCLVLADGRDFACAQSSP